MLDAARPLRAGGTSTWAGSRLVQGTLVSDPTSGVCCSARTDDPDRDYFNLGAGARRGRSSPASSAFFYYGDDPAAAAGATNHLFTLRACGSTSQPRVAGASASGWLGAGLAAALLGRGMRER